MAVNLGGFNPIHHESIHQTQQSQQTNKTETQKNDSPVNNPEMAQLVHQQGEAIPVQQSQESAEAKYTDRESQGGNSSQEEEAESVEEMEKKTKKNIDDLQNGLTQVADGIEQLKDLSQSEKGMPKDLDQRLQKISRMGQRLVVDIERTVQKAVSSMINVGQQLFTISVAELTNTRITVDEFIADMVKRQAKIPTPDVRDQGNRAKALRYAKDSISKALADISQDTNSMLASAEGEIAQLIGGVEEINVGFAEVNKGQADGFKKIEAGFRALFASLIGLTDTTSLFRNQLFPAIKSLSTITIDLEKSLGNRAALGMSEKMSAILWQTPERVDLCWRTIQGYLGNLTTAITKLGRTIEANFEEAAQAVMGQGQVAVDTVNTDLGGIKQDVKNTMSSSAVAAVEQILEGADQVEGALDDLIEASQSKHKNIKRGSVNKKLPSHFNVRL